MLPEDQQTKNKYSVVRQNGGDRQNIRTAFEASLKTPIEIWEKPFSEIPAGNRTSNVIPHVDFESEAQILTIIRHDSILRIYDYNSKNGYHYLAAEITGGRNLQEFFREKPEIFTIANVLKWSEQLIAALDYLQSQTPPLVHGEIKPENIILTQDGKIKLLPFGIAFRSVETPPSRGQFLDATNLNYSPLEQIWLNLDSASQKTLLRNYTEASEQILLRPPDERSNIYALGATLYYLFTHRLPIDALERSIDLLDGKKDPLLAPSALNPAIPAKISDLLMESLAIKRENRLASAATMFEIIKEFSAKTPAVSGETKKFTATASNKTEPTVQKPVFQENTSLIPAIDRVVETKSENRPNEVKKLPETVQKQQLNGETLKPDEVQLPAPPKIIKELLPEKIIEEQKAAQVFEPENFSAETDPNEESFDIVNNAVESKIENKFPDSRTEPAVFENIFAAQPSSRGRRLAMVALVLMMLFGGSALAIWKLEVFKPAVVQQTVSAEEKSPSIKQNEPLPSVTETSATSNELVSPAAEKSEAAAETFESAPPKTETERESGSESQVYKNKSVSPPRIAKQIPAPAKPASEKKKIITVDDLISDN